MQAKYSDVTCATKLPATDLSMFMLQRYMLLWFNTDSNQLYITKEPLSVNSTIAPGSIWAVKTGILTPVSDCAST